MKTDLNCWPIPTWTEPATLDWLASQTRYLKWGLEVGCYMGASARAMLEKSKDFHLWTCDLFQVFGTEQITRLFLNDWLVEGRCEIIAGDSNKAHEILNHHMHAKLDFIFIDDGHAVEDLQRDIQATLPLLKPGGILCGHDFDVPYNDVARGVLSMLPSQDIHFPVPRVWLYRKP